MNYFSHFVIDHQKNNHEYNTGLLLPDITKSWIKSFKNIFLNETFSIHQHELLKGCLQHYHSDKKFHGSLFFHKYYGLLNDEIKNIGLSDEVERKWFIAHIMLELLIDRVILRDNKILLDSFYESLQNVNEISLSDFLKLSGMKNDDEFFKFFNHFRSVQYIYFYADNIKFMYSLNRIMMRANVKELSEQNSAKLLNMMLRFEIIYFNNSAVLLDELKAVFE